jgi:ATP synthase protein I
MADPVGKANVTDRKSLDELGARIDAARQKLDGPVRVKTTKYKTLNRAWQMIVELVVSVVVGGFIGYALDWACGTLPLFMVIFGGFGFAAGMKTMLATARGFVDEDGTATGRDKGDDLG